jgi:hypothetical protein
VVEYAISDWEMSKPAVVSQKPKPEAILARARLSTALLTALQARNAIMMHSTA